MGEPCPSCECDNLRTENERLSKGLLEVAKQNGRLEFQCAYFEGEKARLETAIRAVLKGPWTKSAMLHHLHKALEEKP